MPFSAAGAWAMDLGWVNIMIVGSTSFGKHEIPLRHAAGDLDIQEPFGHAVAPNQFLLETRPLRS